jgi:ABC-type multidrug transport system ATPase subunit
MIMQPADDRPTFPPAVEARGVKVAFDGRPVLQGVDLCVPRGQLVALIGPNGSGKTTLFRCLLGLQRLYAG